MSKQRWLFLGASGLIGRMIRTYWGSCPVDEINVIYQTRGDIPLSGRDMLWSPLENEDGLAEWVNKYGDIDGIFHFAGVLPKPMNPASTQDINVQLTNAVLRAAERASITRILFASSSAVYGTTKDVSYSETCETNPVNAYGEAKLQCEEICREWQQVRGFDICSLRIGNVVGADSLFRNAQQNSPNNAPIKIHQFPNAKASLRSYIGPETLAKIMCFLATSSTAWPQTLNIALPKPFYMDEIARAVKINFEFDQVQSSSSQCITLDCKLLESICDFLKKENNIDDLVQQFKNVSHVI